ncbi:HPP family protein [Noviherbaspirillum sp. UKPF54]|uniref:HPP family protein n=1 Tax=Noviherbaspirillum sp. UKPF54 TaxID=2601898 RepID=UPI0011B18D6C|nr:HPP family protein [Noviherbaspirillum sp. UKPF54]QDZ27904.1 HPP family protein [Noviherbaspirillum sp. UKPF54]
MNRLPRRRRIGLKGELALALLPTMIVLLVLALVEALSRQRLLFASLASSAFLIYLDPENTVNQVRTLLLSQLGSAALGLLSFELLGPGYLSGGIAMLIAIVGMIALDAMHPPAVSTALSFGLRAGDASNLALFSLAVGITALLIGMQKSALWLLRRMS